MKKYIIIILTLILSNISLYANQYSDYRFSYEEMQDIANKDKLSWRIFYNGSKGSDAKWFDAVKKGNLTEVKQMVENGQNIEAKDTASLGQTALGWATFIGYEDMVKYLVSKGANLYATDKGDVYNVFKSAVLGKNVQIVKYLYSIPALKEKISANGDSNINTQEDDGETLVMIASSNNRIETVEYLISLGADINIVSEQRKYNALSVACSRGYIEMQQLLIKNGAVNLSGKASC